MNYSIRQQRLLEAIQGEKLSSFVVTHLPNIRYLCGFTGSAAILVVTAGKRPELHLFTDGRYQEQAAQEVKGAKVSIAKSSAIQDACAWVKERFRSKANAVGVEGERISVATYASLKSLLAPKLRLVPLTGTVERLRMVKESAEIDQIRAAIQLASTVFDGVVGDVVPGVLESSVAAELEYMCRRLGVEGMSFETIVASGPRSALPHGRASNFPIAANGFVIFDFGVILGGYCSDMTRTVHVGRPDQQSIRMYNAVLKAQLAGIKAVKSGVETSKVDQAARQALDNAGLGAYFTHSTGHGVGLEIHEAPALQKTTKAKKGSKAARPERLEAGMVVTIEPGVYIPGKGGVRIEDMVLVTEMGCEVLTPTSKELVVL